MMSANSDNDGENLLSDSHRQYGTMKPPSTTEEDQQTTEGSPTTGPVNHHAGLHRGLSARQVQMIAIAGTIGTGLFLGTGRSLAQGGPSSMLLCYGIIGFVVYVTLLLLGEMATQYPVAGSFNVYAARFFSPSYAFALSWNYWFNDAISVASDLTAAQLVLQYWTPWHPWVISLLFWVFLVGVNAAHVKAYGEIEYWLASLKVITIVIFIIIGILVNVGVNTSHSYIGGHYFHLPGAPGGFVGGFGGFAQVFVTASFAYGGTESLGITAGETVNPSKNMPRVVKFVFWRILLFYILSILLIGLNVPFNYPNLSNSDITTSPFTIVFKSLGSSVAPSFMNTVILTSTLSAANHALFAGTRVLHSLASPSASATSVSPGRQAPALLGRTTSKGVPLPALLATSAVGLLCLGAREWGGTQVWGWLVGLVGVSNQIAWLSIGIASWRFRKAWVRQGRGLDEMKFRATWTWGWGPPFVVVTVIAIIIIQGWSSVIPTFSTVDFITLYLEIPAMIVMYLGWILIRRPNPNPPSSLDAGSQPSSRLPWKWLKNDLVDLDTVDLRRDEYDEVEVDPEHAEEEEREREKRSSGKARWLWKVYYWIV